MLFSVIIPVWKRSKELTLLLQSLNLQAKELNVEVEVVLSDSKSGVEIDNAILKAQVECEKLKILHIHTDNIVAKKRNVGTEKSTGEYLIYLDDDCIPAVNFLQDCINNINNIKNKKTVICGEVRFLEDEVKRSNYYQYRDSRHPHYYDNQELSLNAWSFVSMNYMVSRNQLILNELEYGEDFFGYGAEDHDYGSRLINNGFKIIQGKQKIWHHEYGGSIDKYAIKIYHTARDGMYNLKKVNFNLYSNTTKNVKIVENLFSKNLFLSIFLYYVFFNNLFYLIVVFFLNLIDSKKFLYFDFLYRYVILRSYAKGVLDRKEYDKNVLMNNWYK